MQLPFPQAEEPDDITREKGRLLFAGETEFLDGLCSAGFECQVSAVPDEYLRCVLPDCSDEEFHILFAELRERTYSL